jgi:hypothetical protein
LQPPTLPPKTPAKAPAVTREGVDPPVGRSSISTSGVTLGERDGTREREGRGRRALDEATTGAAIILRFAEPPVDFFAVCFVLGIAVQKVIDR